MPSRWFVVRTRIAFPASNLAVVDSTDVSPKSTRACRVPCTASCATAGRRFDGLPPSGEAHAVAAAINKRSQQGTEARHIRLMPDSSASYRRAGAEVPIRDLRGRRIGALESGPKQSVAVQSGERADWTKLACDRNSKLWGASRRSPRRKCHQTMWTRRPRRHSNVTSYPSSQTIVVWSRRIALRSAPERRCETGGTPLASCCVAPMSG